MTAKNKTIEVELVGSAIGGTQAQRATLLGLGLKKRHQKRVLQSSEAVLGMINKVRHLVKVSS